MKTQMQIFYQEQRKLGELYETFNETVKQGLTRNELAKLIKMRPALWSRFSNWLKVLPN
tara:strand:- start:1397 stop:1573 length:177 start_codon:yes stop_codon:yes gene_type:complete